MKKLLFSITPERSFTQELSVTGLRVFAGLSLALAHGQGKLPPSEGFVDGVAELGFPMPIVFAWAAALAEAVGGFLMALGLTTRLAALSVAITMVVAAFGRHAADPFRQKELALLFLFISLVFVVRGAGRWSADRFLA